MEEKQGSVSSAASVLSEQKWKYYLSSVQFRTGFITEIMYIISKYNIQIPTHRTVLVLILYALLPAKHKWKKIKLEYKQLMKFLFVCLFGGGFFFCFCHKVTTQGKKTGFCTLF